MPVERQRQPQRRGGGGDGGSAKRKEEAAVLSKGSAAQGGNANLPLATLLTPSSPSTSGGKAPSSSQRTLRRQGRASLQSPYPAAGSPRTPRRTGGVRSSTSFTASSQPPKSPLSPSMRALSAIVSLISPFSSARKSAAFGNPDETLDEDDEETRMEEDVEEEDEEEDVASQLYPSLPSEPRKMGGNAAERDDEADESEGEDQAEQASENQDEERDDAKVISGADEDEDAGSEEGYGGLDVTIIESEADQTRPYDAQPIPTPAFGAPTLFGSTSAQRPNGPPSLPPAKSPFRTSAFAPPRFSTPSKMGFGAIAAAPVESAFDDPSAPPVARTPFTFATAGLPAYPRPSIAAKSTSPLSRNYDLLARFFAEKAEQEARAEASTSMNSMDEEEGNETTGPGLTEIEMAGCMHLIEQSYAHGQGAEIDRLRQEALERGRRYDASRQQLLDEEEIAFARGHHTNRSPSLPLGAAAGEASLGEQYGSSRSRASSSFLAPSHQRNDDARVNRSLATAFQSAPASNVALARRHRPLYLGPGLGASASAAILRRNQQAQARRGALNNHRAAQQARLQDASRRAEEQINTDTATKRRKLPGDHDDRPALFTTPALQPPAPVPVPAQAQPQSTLARPAKRPAPEAAPQVTTARSATADAMLSILNSGPPIPSRKIVAPPVVSNPDVVNPYETTSRLTRRTTGASSLAAKEKERLREERERRLKAMKEKEEREANETLRRAARAQSAGKKRGIRMEGDDDDEDEDDAAAQEKEQQERKKKIEEDRRRKNEELKRRTEMLLSKPKAAADGPKGDSTANPSEGTSDQITKSSESKAAPVPAAAKPFSFNSAFAPKKPSPLSQAATSTAPDSPSGSSEASEHTMKSSMSPGKFAFGTPASTSAPIVLDDDDDEPQVVATNKPTMPQAAFNFGAKPASTPSSKPSIPSFTLPSTSSANKAATTSATTQKPIFALSPAAARPPNAAQSPSEQAARAEVSSLPKFDFALDIVVANASTQSGSPSADDKAARDAALRTSITALPKFDFGQTPPSTTNGAATFQFNQAPTVAPSSSPSDASVEATSAGEGKTSALLSGTGEGEEDEECVHEARCKVWSLSGGKWNDLGIGMLRIKKNRQTSKQRVLVRNEGNGKVTVNFSMYASLKPTQDKNVVSFLGFDAAGKPMSYRCKIKTDDAARQLKEALEASASTAT